MHEAGTQPHKMSLSVTDRIELSFMKEGERGPSRRRRLWESAGQQTKADSCLLAFSTHAASHFSTWRAPPVPPVTCWYSGQRQPVLNCTSVCCPIVSNTFPGGRTPNFKYIVLAAEYERLVEQGVPQNSTFSVLVTLSRHLANCGLKSFFFKKKKN